MGDASTPSSRGLIALQFAAFWPVWIWAVDRARTTPEGLWCLVPIAWLVVLVLRDRDDFAPGLPSILFLAAYAATFVFVPPIVRATIAMLSLACRRSRFDFAIAGLLLVSLPVVTTLQVYVGFHLRLLATWATVPLLRMAGYAVGAEGTALRWGDQIVLVDGPCSGIKMLWVGFVLAFALAAWRKLGNFRCLAAAAITLVAVLAGNVLRAAGLFFLETGIVEGPRWAHDGAGGVAFLLVAVVIVAAVLRLSRGRA